MEPPSPEARSALRFDAERGIDLEFPPLPRTVAEVSSMLAAREEVPDTPRLVDVVNADPLIAVAVLRRVNSAYYGLRRPVGEVRHAVFLLGFEEVCNLVLTASVLRLRDVLRSEEQERVFDALLRMSLGAGYYAQVVAGHLDLPAKRAAFAAGLMHNVGRLVFLYNAPHEYEALWFTTLGGRLPSIHDEERIFGVDHGVLGALAGERWNLPEEIIQAVRLYSVPALAPVGPMQRFAQAISVAAGASTQLCQHDPSEPWSFVPPVTLAALCEPLSDVGPLEIAAIVEQHRTRAEQYIGMLAAQ